MVVEIMGGNGLHKAFKELDIETTRTYRGSEKPHYEVWEISKEDLKKLEYAAFWEDGWGWWSYSKGEHRGTACDFLTINGVDVIAWQEDSMNDSFKCFTDYCKDCLGITEKNKICAYSVYLAKTNGWSLSELWKKLEG